MANSSSPALEPGVKFSISEPSVLVVEGDEDKVFFEAFIRRLNLRSIQVMGIGGKSLIRPHLRTLKIAPGHDQLSSLGIIRDADTDPQAAFRSVCDALKYAGFSAPKSPEKFIGTKPRIGVMILPGKDRGGMLESICLESVRKDPAMQCVEQYFNCLKDNHVPNTKNIFKAKTHAFLASRKEPDKRLGEAALAGYWPFDSPAFDEVKKFVGLLVNPR